MNIRGKGNAINIKQDIIGRISINDRYSYKINNNTSKESNFILFSKKVSYKIQPISFGLEVSEKIYSNISENDIIKIEPNGKFEILFSTNSNDNSLFITENCNSRCIFCPQPPKNTNDLKHFSYINNAIVDNLHDSTEYIGITGGEPLLGAQYLFDLLERINLRLPKTEVQVLTNGKLLADDKYFSTISTLINENYIFAIPLYSDYENDHDKIVGANKSFRKTLKGLYNLASIGARIEIRIVLNAITLPRLKRLAEFIFKNLTFVEHVAFMGLEITGMAKKNFNYIWNNDIDYKSILKDSIIYLSNWGIQCSIYNIPLCCLPEEIREFSAKSISDWKQYYKNDCSDCSLKSDCGGLFSTSGRNIYLTKSLSSEEKNISPI